MKVLRLCITCGGEFMFRNAPSDIKAGNGKYCSNPCRDANMSKVLKMKGIQPKVRFLAKGAAHPKWKGDKVSYSGLHYWVARCLGKPTKCQRCGQDGLTGKAIHWSNISGGYKRDLSDWQRLCTPCHKTYDLRRLSL